MLLLVALSAPQDCGKTTVVDFLVELFAEHAGLCCAVIESCGQTMDVAGDEQAVLPAVPDEREHRHATAPAPPVLMIAAMIWRPSDF